jgi:hypothetical protein
VTGRLDNDNLPAGTPVTQCRAPGCTRDATIRISWATDLLHCDAHQITLDPTRSGRLFPACRYHAHHYGTGWAEEKGTGVVITAPLNGPPPPDWPVTSYTHPTWAAVGRCWITDLGITPRGGTPYRMLTHYTPPLAPGACDEHPGCIVPNGHHLNIRTGDRS